MDLARNFSRLSDLLSSVWSSQELPDLQQALDWAASDNQQRAIPWPQKRWITAFPRQRGLLSALPDLLTRSDVRAVCDQLPETPRGATDAFIVSMAWGYGQANYGIHRTQKVLDTAGAEAGRSLARAARLATEEGPEGAYEHLAGHGRLHGLGPAFGTKFLYFHNQDALILDQVIADWFMGVTGKNLRPTAWNLDSYTEYLAAMECWAAEAGLPADRLEEAAFSTMSDALGNQWARDRR